MAKKNDTSVREKMGAPDVLATDALDVDLTEKYDRVAEFAARLAELEPERVRHYVYRLAEDGSGRKIGVGSIDDMPDRMPMAHDYGERFILPGCYFCITEVRYFEGGQRKTWSKAGPREYVGPDYQERAERAERVSLPEDVARVAPMAAAAGSLDLVFQYLDRFADVALRLRGEVAPPAPPDVQALRSSYEHAAEILREQMAQMRTQHAADMRRLRESMESDRPTPEPANDEPDDPLGGLGGLVDAAGKAVRVVGEVRDLFGDKGGQV